MTYINHYFQEIGRIERVNAMDKERIVKYAIIIMLLLSIFPLVYVSIYSRPSADDYNYAVTTYNLIKSGEWDIFALLKKAFELDLHFYNTWQGLYTSAFILSLHPGIFGEEYYFIGSLLLMFILWISVYIFFSEVAKKVVIKERKMIFNISLLILVVLLQGMPSITQGIYWFNGAWNYTFFFCITLINCSMIINYCTNNKRLGLLIFSTILSFLISGGNHVTAFLNIMILFLFLVLFIRKKSGIIFPFISALIGWGIMFNAPGTAVRQERLSQQGIVGTIIHAGWGAYKYICDWINIQFLAFLVLLIPCMIIILRNVDIDYKRLKIHPIITIVVEVVILCGMLSVPYMAMGTFGADRVINVVWFTFIILSTLNWIYLLLWSKVLLQVKNVKYNKNFLFLLVLVCFLICFYNKSNTLLVLNDIKTGTAVEYAEACDERYAIMEESNQSDIVYVEPLPYESVLFFSDLSTDVTNWKNVAWKEYFGIETAVKE